MTTTEMPTTGTELKNDSDNERIRRDLPKMLPPAFKKVADANKHLYEYLYTLPIADIGVPVYVPELTRKHGENKAPNLIYPSRRKGCFAHILLDRKDARNSYIAVEPHGPLNLTPLLLKMENKMLDLGNKLPRVDLDGDLEAQFLNYVAMTITTDTNGVRESLIHRLRRYLHGGIRAHPLVVTELEQRGLEYLFIRDKLGLAVMDPLIEDPYIEDISCSGIGPIFIEHKIFKSLKTSIGFDDMTVLDDYVLWMGHRIGKAVTYKEPIMDAALPDGSRINLVFGEEISKRGSNFTIRKFSETPISIFELVEFGTINYEMLAYLSLVIGHGMNVFISGETASGKTTMLNAATTFIQPSAKIVSIEDTPELQVPHANWIREVVQSTKAEDEDSVTMFDLLKAALRQRPDQIIIGEIRGVEGNVAFQAMQTGHSVMATFHAASIEKLIQRITGNPISVPKSYVDNLNVVVFLSAVKLPNGKNGRRVIAISEIVGYDPGSSSFSCIESFQWKQETDRFEFTGYMASYILEHKISSILGIPKHKKTKIYAEVSRRVKIFERIHREQGVTDFYEVLDVFAKAMREGLL